MTSLGTWQFSRTVVAACGRGSGEGELMQFDATASSHRMCKVVMGGEAVQIGHNQPLALHRAPCVIQSKSHDPHGDLVWDISLEHGFSFTSPRVIVVARAGVVQRDCDPPERQGQGLACRR